MVFLIVAVLVILAFLLFVALGAVMLTTWLSSPRRRHDKG